MGGFAGDSDDGDPDVYDSYWDSVTSETSTSDGGTIKTTWELIRQSTFNNWDFINTWLIVERQTYPALRFYNRADLNKDGIVDIIDFSILGENWLDTTG